MRAGLAFALGTPLSRLAPVVSCIDALLLLSRVTGEGTRGAAFDPLVVDAFRALDKEDLLTLAGTEEFSFGPVSDRELVFAAR